MLKTKISSLYSHTQNQFINAFYSAFGIKLKAVSIIHTPNVLWGDLTIACFEFTKQIKESPSNIAQKVVQNMKKTKFIERISATGPYINIKIRSSVFFRSVCEEAIIMDKKFGLSISPIKERIMVEYLSPNTNKPLHLGHARNGILGMAVSNLLEAIGHKIIRVNLINDRGVHICKSMVAYDKWGSGETPESRKIKGDHFVGNFYVLYAKNEGVDHSLGEDVQKYLQKWEANDKKIIALWKLMNKWAYSGFKQTYCTFGFVFDATYFESKIYKLGKDIVQKGVSMGVFEKLPGGVIIARLPIDKFGEDKDGKQRIVTLIRNDGTSVYITQDLGTAVLKFKEYNLTRSIHIVGNEQEHHFKYLFYFLKQLGYPWADNCYHLSYGMVYLPEGRMKSREGKVVDADDLSEEMTSLARKEIVNRADRLISKKEIIDRAKKIGMAAIKFYLLRVNSEKDIYFNPKESLSFEGNTGPYCQYAYTRAQSILRRKEVKQLEKQEIPDFSLLGAEEELLIVHYIMQLPDVIKKSAETLNPYFLCDWVYNTAKAFNQFYQKHRVIDPDISPALVSARIKLLRAFSIAIRQGLTILGIETVDEM